MNFGQKPWIIPLEKCHVWHFLELWFSGLKIVLFYPKYQKMIWLVFSQKKKKIRKSLMFRQKPWIMPFGKCRCFALLKTFFLRSKNHSFLSRTSKKQYFLTWFYQKTQRRKISIFKQKRWIIPSGKCLFLALFTTSIVWSKNHSFLSKI